jgi:hypothetical protein
MRRVAKFKPITPDLRSKVKKLIGLNDAHAEAIRGGDQSFYSDGRHDELLALTTEVHAALGVKPWEDDRAKLHAALSYPIGPGA